MSKLFTFTYPAVFGRSQAPSAFSCHGIRMQHRLGVRKIEKEVRDLATGMRIIHLPLILKSCQPASNHPSFPNSPTSFQFTFFFLTCPCTFIRTLCSFLGLRALILSTFLSRPRRKRANLLQVSSLNVKTGL